MSGYSGRKGPNVSQYLANLNAVPSAQEIAARQDDNFSFEDDLAIFTNTEFFDYDSGFSIAQQPIEYDTSQDETVKQGNTPVLEEDVKNLGFDNGMCASIIPYLSLSTKQVVLYMTGRYRRNSKPSSLHERSIVQTEKHTLI